MDDERTSVLDRILEDLAGMVVLYGIFWAIAKMYRAMLRLAGWALIAVNETLIFVCKPIIRMLRKKKAQQALPEIIVRIPIVEQRSSFYDDLRRDTDLIRIAHTQKMLPERKRK